MAQGIDTATAVADTSVGRAKPTKGRKGNGRKGAERGKGWGSLEWRKRKGWVARWTVDGKRFTKSLGNIAKDKAKEKLADLTAPTRVKDEIKRGEMLQGILDGAKGRLKRLEDAKPHLLISDAYDAYENSPERPDTASDDRLRLNRARFGFFVSYMADNYPDITEMRKVEAVHAQGFTKSKYLAGKSGGTFNAIVGLCNLIWRTLEDDADAALTQNPWRKIKRKRETPTRRRELTEEELRNVCAAARGELRVLFAVGIYTGLRLGDCALLKWSDIDTDRRLIFTTPRKTKSKTGLRVVIPLHAGLAAILAEIPQAKRRGYVVPKCADQYLNGTMNLVNSIRAVFKSCGIETQTRTKTGRNACLVGFHSLRHSAVSLMANAGVPMAVVQSIVGHSTIEMTRHYFHESEDALKNAIRAIPCLTGNGGTTDGADAPTGVLGAFYAMADKMTDEERRKAADYLKRLEAGSAGDAVEIADGTPLITDAGTARLDGSAVGVA